MARQDGQESKKKKKKAVLLSDRPGGTFLPPRPQSMLAERRGTFFGDRRVSVAEAARRSSWLERTRRASLAVRNRGNLLHEVRFPDAFHGVFTLRYSPGGDSLATGFGAGAIQVRDPDTGELKATLRAGMDHTLPVMGIRFHPMNTDVFYAASADGFVYICNAERYDFSKHIEEKNNEINAIDVSVTGEILATAGKDAVVRLYDASTTQLISKYGNGALLEQTEELPKYHRARVYALRFHSTMRDTFVTGGWDDIVKIWDTRDSHGCIRNIRGPHICGDAIDLKEKVVLTGSWIVSGSLQLWDIGTARLIETVRPANRPTTLDGEFLYTVHYFDGDPYGEMVCAGGSGTGCVEVISLKEKRVLGSFQVNKATQAIDSHGNIIAFAGMETVIRLGEFS